MPESLVEKLKSRKLWVAVIAAALLALADQLGIDKEAADNIVQIVAAYLLAQGVKDSVEAYGNRDKG